jgi:hypothetical protein
VELLEIYFGGEVAQDWQWMRAMVPGIGSRLGLVGLD